MQAVSLRKDVEHVQSCIQSDINSLLERANVAQSQQIKHEHKDTSRQASCTQSDLTNNPRLSVFTMLLQRDPAFLGRQDELRELHRRLESDCNPSQPISCAIEGGGGVGKTQVALEYAHRYGSRYQAIFWMGGGSTVELRSAYGAIGRKLRLFDTEDIDRPKIEKVQEWFQSDCMCA